MPRLNVMEARKTFGKTVNRVAFGKERIILERRGEDVVAIVPVEDVRLLERLERDMEDRIDAAEADRILDDAKPGDFVPWEQVKKALGL